MKRDQEYAKRPRLCKETKSMLSDQEYRYAERPRA